MFAEMQEFSPTVRTCAPPTSCRPVTASDFMSLMLSRRQMFRFDDPGTAVLGLLDPETGVRYVIDECEYARSLGNPSNS